MCYWMNVDGHAVHVNTGRKPKYCDCGHVAPFLCDWKMPANESGTCDKPICAKHAEQVGENKHLCLFHSRAWADWKRRHPDRVPVVAEQPQQLKLL